MKKQAKDLMAQIALAQGAVGWRQAVQEQAGRTVLAVPETAFALPQSRQFPAVLYSAVGDAMGRYTYMPDVVSGFLRRHRLWLSSAWMARIEALIRQHLDDPSQNEPQPEVWRPLAQALARWQAQPDGKEPTMKQYKPLQPIREMARISREELAARLDEILARVDKRTSALSSPMTGSRISCCAPMRGLARSSWTTWAALSTAPSATRSAPAAKTAPPCASLCAAI